MWLTRGGQVRCDTCIFNLTTACWDVALLRAAEQLAAVSQLYMKMYQSFLGLPTSTVGGGPPSFQKGEEGHLEWISFQLLEQESVLELASFSCSVTQ